MRVKLPISGIPCIFLYFFGGFYFFCREFDFLGNRGQLLCEWRVNLCVDGKSVLEEEIPRHIITGRGESETHLEAFDWFKKGNLFLIGKFGRCQLCAFLDQQRPITIIFHFYFSPPII